MDIIQTKQENGILTLTLNRPDKFNALNSAVLTCLSERLQQAKQDKAVKGLLITGQGKAFCAGADISELASCDALQGYAFAVKGQQVFQQFEDLGKPSIALVNGVALGGGCELSQATTIRIASEIAKFGQPEIKLGVIPGYGGTQRLSRLIGKGRALELCLTGRMIDAQTALQYGLVTEVVSEATLIERGEALLTSLIQYSPVALESIMDLIHTGYDIPLKEALDMEALHFAKICATQDKNEGVKAFLEKRKPAFQGI